MEDHGRSLKAKPKHRFTLCCFCTGNSNSDPDLSTRFDYSDRCEYVVEKLAIKKVPIALFATEEDLAEMRNSAVLDKYHSKYDSTIGEEKELESTLYSYYTVSKRNENAAQIHQNRHHRSIDDFPIEKFTNTSRQGPLLRDVSVDVLKPSNDRQSIALSTSTLENAYVEKKHDRILGPKMTIRETVRADVHQQHDENVRRYKITPELEQTLTVLGSKRDPIPNIKQKLASKPAHPADIYQIQTMSSLPTPVLKPVEIKFHEDKNMEKVKENIEVEKSGGDKSEVMMPTMNITGSANKQPKVSFAPLKKHLPARTCCIIPEEDLRPKVVCASFKKQFPEPTSCIIAEQDTKPKVVSMSFRKPVQEQACSIAAEQDVQTKLTYRDLDSLINGMTDANKSSSQKWKIIIKEHDKEFAKSTSSTSESSTETESEESDVEESTE